MKENIRAKLLGLCRRLEELDAMLAAPDAADDMKRFTELSRERAEIEPVVLKTKEYEQTLEDIATAEEMAKDPEVAEFAREEMLSGKKKLDDMLSRFEPYRKESVIRSEGKPLKTTVCFPLGKSN